MGWIDWISGENNLNFEKGAECRINTNGNFNKFLSTQRYLKVFPKNAYNSSLIHHMGLAWL
ncbi:MAG: hypothetical protein JKX90_04360 [Colwellia sp.]|nr:hypothetical protein [Colwellia sp.]